MPRKIIWYVLPLVLVGIGVLFVLLPKSPNARLAAKTLSPLEKAGQKMFLQGVDSTGEAILGVWEGSDFEISGSAIACAKCHGMTGKGSEEGGLLAPDIRSQQLFQMRPADRLGQRGREALDELSLKTIITQGFAPGGRRLHQAMPRFNLNESQWEALYAYLSVLGQTVDPGLSHEVIRIGISPDEEKTFRDMIQAYFDFVNERGGIYRRRIVLISDNEAESFLRLGFDSAMAMDEMQPILVTNAAADEEQPARPLSYFLSPGPYIQAAASLEFAHRNFSKPVMLIAEDDQDARAWINGARSESMRRGQGEPEVCLYPADGSGLDACAARAAGSVVLFQGDEEGLLVLGRWLKQQGSEVPLIAFGGDIRQPDGSRELIHAQPNLCVSTADSLIGNMKPMNSDFMSYLSSRGRSQTLSQVEIQAWRMGSLIEEVLIRVGTDLSRLGFVEALEHLRYFRAGRSAPLTFSRTQKIGSQGAYITCSGEGPQLLETWISVVR